MSPSREEFAVATTQRSHVATWLRLKAAGTGQDMAFYERVCGGREQAQAMFEQLETDALHSGLLNRLFLGEQPREDTR